MICKRYTPAQKAAIVLETGFILQAEGVGEAAQATIE